MYYDVVEARYLRDYVVWLRFRDGSSGEVDLESSMHGPVFEPLKATQAFQRLFVHPEFRTLAWPNDVDLDSEALYERVRLANPPTNDVAQVGDSPTQSADYSKNRWLAAVRGLRPGDGADAMPEISRFFGIVITMRHDEHGVPHFHAEAGEFAVSVEIEREIVRGQFPAAKLRHVQDWLRLHRTELLANWERARRNEPLLPIEPLT